MNIKSFKAVFPKEDLIASPESFFASIKFQYREYRSSGVYANGSKYGYYIYQIETPYGLHTGLLCSTSVKDLLDKKILMHEKTLANKEQQMMHLLMQRKALVKPVLLGYHPIDTLNEDFIKITKNKKAKVSFTFDDGEKHSIWAVYNATTIKKIEASFLKLQNAYVGDGHHRTTTVSLLNSSQELGKDAAKYSHLLTAYFPFDQLQIWDFNRVFDISEIMRSSAFIAELSKYFNIKKLNKAQKPKIKHELTFFIDKVWYSMTWKNKFIKKQNSIVLDSALINKFVFGKILKIKDVRTDNRIKYYGGTEPIQKLIKQANKIKNGVALCIYPVSVDELTKVADKGKTLPPKSTWFLPRLKSGIIAKDL